MICWSLQFNFICKPLYSVQEYSYIELYTLEYHYPDFALLFHLFKRTLLTLHFAFSGPGPCAECFEGGPILVCIVAFPKEFLFKFYCSFDNSLMSQKSLCSYNFV